MTSKYEKYKHGRVCFLGKISNVREKQLMKPTVRVIGIHHNQDLFIRQIAVALKNAGSGNDRIVDFVTEATRSNNPYYLLSIAPDYVRAV